LVEEQESSGLTVRAFALERGVSAWALYGWRQRLGRSRRRRRRIEDRGESKFVAVDVVAGSASGEIEVVLGDGVRVRLPSSTSLERLLGLVQGLRAC